MALTRPRAHQLSGTSAKAAVRVVSESNVTLSGGAPATVDGVSLTLDDRILVTGQSTASQNGLYRCTVVGSGSNGTWVRSRDGSHDGTISAGMTTIVTEGSTYADTLWKLTTDGTITIGTTALAFSQHSGGSSTITQGMIGSNVAGTGPSFKATMSAVTAISNSGATKLVLDTEEWDTNSNYDNATNYRFTPTVAGYYSLSGSMFMSTATTARVGVAIYKNGSEHAWQFTAGVSSGGGANPQVSTIVYANGSTDYFELYAAQNYTSSVNASNNSVITWFSGALVRSA